MTWYAPRQPLAWTLEGLPQSDLYQANMRMSVFSPFVIPRGAPGEPAKRVNAGMTVLGGMMVPSAILVQSLIIVNFPCGSKSVRKVRMREVKDVRGERIHDNTILPDLHMVANSRRFYDGIGTDVNIVTNLHRVIVKCATICLVRRPERITTRYNEIASGERGRGLEMYLMTHPSPTRQ